MANIKIPATGQSDIYIHGTNVSGNGTVYIGQKVVTLQTGGTFVPNDIDVTVKADVQLKQGWLANSLASGETLSDFQEDTSGNTVVPVGGNLYIHEGWYPATRISLGQLIPDISTNDAANGHILSGYKAYDENGNLLEGTIATVSPTFSGGSLTVTGTVTDYSAPSVTINATGKFLPSGTGNVGATYGVTTTAPTSGTEGTNYLSIDATGTPNNGSCKAQGSATRAKFNWNQNTVGYLSKTSGTEAIAAQTTPTTGKGDAYTITPGVTDSFTKLYIPIVSCSFSGGGVTATAGGSVTTAPVVTYSESCSGKNSEGTTLTASNYGIETTTADSTNGYFTFVASGASTDGTVQATANASMTAVTYTNSAGAIAAHSGTQAVAAGNATQATSNITVTPTATAGTTTKYRVKVVAPTASKPSITVSTTTPSITCSATDVVISHTGGFYSEDAADNYGVHNGDVPSGMTDGVDCLALKTSGSGGTLSYSGTVALDVSRAAIKGSGTFRGVCDVTTSTTFRSAENYTLTSGSVSGSTNATITGGADYYIPIVSCEFYGGAVTATADGSVKTAPKVTYSASCAGKDGNGNSVTIGNYGIATTTSSSTNGYITFTSSGIGTNGTVQATADASRTAVTYTNRAGAIVAHSGSTASAAASARQNTKNITVTPTATAGTTTKYRIPIVSCTFSGGGVTATAGGSVTTAPVVTYTESVDGKNGNGTTLTAANYGITTADADSTNGYFTFTANGSSTTTGVVNATASASSTAVTVTNSAGAIAANSAATAVAAGSGSDNTNINVTATATRGTTSRYKVPVRSVSSTVDHTLTAPSVTISQSYVHNVQGTIQQTNPDGILGGTPSDLSTYTAGYLFFSPSHTETNGSTTATGHGTISAGITAGGTANSTTSTKNIVPTVNEATSYYQYYIKVYDGSYTLV